MEGVIINNIDIAAEHGATLLAGSYAELLKPADTKEWVSNENPRENGTAYLPPTEVLLAERSVSLTFCINGDDTSDFLSKYTGFIDLLKSGPLSLYVPDLDRYYRLIYQGGTSFDQFELTTCKIAVKFIEPNPAN